MGQTNRDDPDAFIAYRGEFKSRMREREPSRWGVKDIVGVTIVVFLAGIIVFSRLPNGGQLGKLADDKPDEWLAMEMAKKHVRLRLKAPSTAEFPISDFTASDSGGGEWRVSSYVDGQNSFCATIRTYWTVKMRNRDKAWELIDIAIQP